MKKHFLILTVLSMMITYLVFNSEENQPKLSIEVLSLCLALAIAIYGLITWAITSRSGRTLDDAPDYYEPDEDIGI